MLNNDYTNAIYPDINGDGVVTAADVTSVYEVLLNGYPVPERLVGGDISMITKYEQNGAIYKDRNGNTISNILPYFGEQGWNAMRVRLFVNPENASSTDKEEGVIQDLPYVKALGKRI
ncbi:MAG: glycosyl hydrolase 53 family protein, partial [Muribaculaceae bacterium]|nr:glycosyl hydrolase 53 family protein [Muribaculaceae bacterium]